MLDTAITFAMTLLVAVCCLCSILASIRSCFHVSLLYDCTATLKIEWRRIQVYNTSFWFYYSFLFSSVHFLSSSNWKWSHIKQVSREQTLHVHSAKRSKVTATLENHHGIALLIRQWKGIVCMCWVDQKRETIICDDGLMLSKIHNAT